MDLEFIPVGRAHDITGQRFSRLEVLGRAPDGLKKYTAYWWCKCDCGNIVKIRGDQLRGNFARSCGCYAKEKAAEQGKKLAAQYNKINGAKHIKDLKGCTYGHLTVIKDSGKRAVVGNGTNVIWVCQCDCGNIVEVTGGHLQSGHTQSCGCQKKSRGEEKISKLLAENGFSFISEYRDKNLTFSTGGVPKFDFFVDNSYYIEYDGEQHFDCENHGWNDEKNFQLTQQRDKEKNNYCIKNNIPLIRIPYTRFKTLCIQDLIPTEDNPWLITKQKV